MKKLQLLAIAFVFGTASLFALNVTHPDESTKKLRTEIIELLEAPEFTVNYEVIVIINFTFNSEGEIVVLAVNSTDSDILNYIRGNLNGKKIENPGERDKLFTMPLKVKEV